VPAVQNPTSAKAMYDDCLAQLGAAYDPSKIKGMFTPAVWDGTCLTFLEMSTDGLFGAMMQVSSTNDVRSDSVSTCLRFPSEQQ
jgi:hypothetical protein